MCCGAGRGGPGHPNHLGPAEISELTAQVDVPLKQNILGADIAAPVWLGGGTIGMIYLSVIDLEKLAENFLRAPRTTVDALGARAAEAACRSAWKKDTNSLLVQFDSCCHTEAVGRARRRARLARPYICRLTGFSLVMLTFGVSVRPWLGQGSLHRRQICNDALPE